MTSFSNLWTIQSSRCRQRERERERERESFNNKAVSSPVKGKKTVREKKQNRCREKKNCDHQQQRQNFERERERKKVTKQTKQSEKD